jgi:hypothetical protein
MLGLGVSDAESLPVGASPVGVADSVGDTVPVPVDDSDTVDVKLTVPLAVGGGVA